MPKKGQPVKGRGAKGILRPQLWIHKDPLKHEMHHPWQARRAQAKFRGEEWDLSFDEFYELWKNDWYNRGRQRDNVCMSRKDSSLPWNKDNTIIVVRYDHLVEQAKASTGKSKPRKKNV